MPRKSKALSDAQNSSCAIRRSVGVLSDPWSFLLLREAFIMGRRTFAEFRDELGIATDILTSRLNNFVANGIMQKAPYQAPGQRTRHAYVLTAAGQELKVVLIALQQWGDQHLPSAKPLGVRPVVRDSERPVRVILVDLDGALVDQADTEFVRADAVPVNAMRWPSPAISTGSSMQSTAPTPPASRYKAFEVGEHESLSEQTPDRSPHRARP